MPKPYGATTKGQIDAWLKQQEKGRRFTTKQLWINLFRYKVSKSTIAGHLNEFAANGKVKRCQVMLGRNSTWIIT